MILARLFRDGSVNHQSQKDKTMSENSFDNWDEIQEIFAEAIQLENPERIKYLRQRCQNNEELFQQAVTLVDAFETSADKLEVPSISVESQPEAQDYIIEIPGYTVGKEIHRGGQGVVFQAKQLGTKRTVAIKFLLSGHLAGPASRHRFKREVELVSQLRHPGIVPIFDSGIARGQNFYVMEFVDGLTLNKYVKKNRPEVESIAQLFVLICDAVGAAHKKGILHRDLKPSNIMVTDSGEPRVLDFGLAKLAGTDNDETKFSMTGQIMGTLAYMSPEQAVGRQNDLEPSCDVYSLGVMFYELLSGHNPHKVDGTTFENLLSIQKDEIVAVHRVDSRIPPGLSLTIAKSMSKDASQQYADASEFGADIKRYLDGEPVLAKGESLYSRLRKKVAKNSLQFVIALALLIGLGGGYLLNRYMRSAPPVPVPLRLHADGSKFSETEFQSQVEAMEIIVEHFPKFAFRRQLEVRFGSFSKKNFDVDEESQGELDLLLDWAHYLKYRQPDRKSVTDKWLKERDDPEFTEVSGRTRYIIEEVQEYAFRPAPGEETEDHEEDEEWEEDDDD